VGSSPTCLRRGLWAVRALVVLALSSALLAWLFNRVVVSGESMFPTLLPGDRLLVLRMPALFRRRVGGLVAFRDPRKGAGLRYGDNPEGRLMVKRVVSVDADGVEVRGDNEAASTDSRTFGTVPLELVAGVVVYRYAPEGRVGLVR